MQLPISIVISTMNRPESLYRTLMYLFSGNDTPHQIVVIDQSLNSTIRDENKKILQKYNDGHRILIYDYQETPSLTKARNRGFRKVVNEIVVFADDDIDVNKDTITSVYRLMQNTTIAMVAGIDEFTQVSSTNIGYFLGTKSYMKRKIGHVTHSMLGRYPDNIKKQVETQWAQGFFFVVRKSLMDKWHCKWDENLTSYAYAEDLDFSFGYYKHAHAENLKCVIDPSVRVKHLATKEYRIPSAKSIYMYVINRTYLSHKHKMGLVGIIASVWCNMWRLIQSAVLHHEPIVLAHAIWCSIKYRKNIIAGNLDYDKFMK